MTKNNGGKVPTGDVANLKCSGDTRSLTNVLQDARDELEASDAALDTERSISTSLRTSVIDLAAKLLSTALRNEELLDEIADLQAQLRNANEYHEAISALVLGDENINDL